MVNWFKRLRMLKFWQVLMAFVVLAGAGAGAYYGVNTWLNQPKTTASATTVQYLAVAYGDISQTLTVSGSLSYYNTQQLTFGASGTIKEVKIAAGDNVAKDAVLATFDDASNRALQKALLQAQVALATAQANLDSARHPYTHADIAAAQASITSAQIAINTAQTNLDKAKNPYSDIDIAQAELAVMNAQTALTTAQSNLDKAEHPYTDAEIAAAAEAVQTAQTYYSNVYIKAHGDIADAQYQVQDAWTAYQNALLHGTSTDKTRTLNDYQSALANLAIVQANAIKSIQSAQDALTQAQNNLAAVQATPDASNIQKKQYELLIAQLNLAKAQDNLATMQTAPDSLDILQKQQQLTTAQNNLTKAKQNLADMHATPDAVTIQLKKLELENAQAALDLAQQQAQYNALVAPSAGTITTVNIKAGQAVNASTVAVEMIDPSVFALTASVSELDITQVKVGQSASVSVDALSGRKLSGKVGSIATSATSQSGVVSYKVTVLVTAPSDVQLMAGMSSSADVTVQEANHVLVVPNKAIGGTTSNPTVTVMVSGQAEIVSVKTGLSDDTYTEVTQGLKEGDSVAITTSAKASSTRTATTTTRTTATTTTRTSQQQFPGEVVPTGGPPGTAPAGGFIFTSVP